MVIFAGLHRYSDTEPFFIRLVMDLVQYRFDSAHKAMTAMIALKIFNQIITPYNLITIFGWTQTTLVVLQELAKLFCMSCCNSILPSILPCNR